jgi:adenine-specific DNA-methyltransferase
VNGIRTESELVRIAEGLVRGSQRDGGVDGAALRAVQREIEAGGDPLGDALCRVRSPVERRERGAVYTPPEIVRAMAEWATRHAAGSDVSRIVDPGAGSGRFLRAVSARFPSTELVAVELDPVAALLCRATLAVVGLTERLRVVQGDYRGVKLGATRGRTLFLGNPPYVRHHGIDPKWKRWLSEQAKRLGYGASQLAGLHVHFFLATALHGRAGDFGAFITSAEWLDVNYGRLLRELLLGPLGGLAVHSLDAAAEPFAGAMTTAAITTFELGARPAALKFRRVARLAELAPLEGGRSVSRERASSSSRWTSLFRALPRRPSGTVELGELFRVHRGQVTGRNAVWIAGTHSAGLPSSLAYPTVTRAKELFASGMALTDASALRSVIDLPADLDELSVTERRAVERFLRVARSMGAHEGFIARHRRAWWSVGLATPAPILATYMARRPPAFVRNVARARHINIAHGLYPREPITQNLLDAYARCLATGTSRADGRTYAGGLTKFEPKEMERLLVPSPECLGD